MLWFSDLNDLISSEKQREILSNKNLINSYWLHFSDFNHLINLEKQKNRFLSSVNVINLYDWLPLWCFYVYILPGTGTLCGGSTPVPEHKCECHCFPHSGTTSDKCTVTCFSTSFCSSLETTNKQQKTEKNKCKTKYWRLKPYLHSTSTNPICGEVGTLFKM